LTFFLGDQKLARLHSSIPPNTSRQCTLSSSATSGEKITFSGNLKKVNNHVGFYTDDLLADHYPSLSKLIKVECDGKSYSITMASSSYVAHPNSPFGQFEKKIKKLFWNEKPPKERFNALMEELLDERSAMADLVKESSKMTQSLCLFDERILAWAFIYSLAEKSAFFIRKFGNNFESLMDIVWSYIDEDVKPYPPEFLELAEEAELEKLDRPYGKGSYFYCLRRLADILARKSYGE
jgi:hypothetical protein